MAYSDSEKAERKMKFLNLLRRGLTVTGAYTGAGINESTLYLWRREDSEFADHWDESRRVGLDSFIDIVSELSEGEVIVEIDPKTGDYIPLRDPRTGQPIQATDPIDDTPLFTPDGKPIWKPRTTRRVNDKALAIRAQSLDTFAQKRVTVLEGTIRHQLEAGEGRVRDVIDAKSLTLEEINVLLPMLHRRLPEGPDKQRLGWSLGIGADRALPVPHDVVDADYVEVTSDP